MMPARRAGPRLTLLCRLVAGERLRFLALWAVGVDTVLRVTVAPEPVKARRVVRELGHELHQGVIRFGGLGADGLIAVHRGHRKTSMTPIYAGRTIQSRDN